MPRTYYVQASKLVRIRSHYTFAGCNGSYISLQKHDEKRSKSAGKAFTALERPLTESEVRKM